MGRLLLGDTCQNGHLQTEENQRKTKRGDRCADCLYESSIRSAIREGRAMPQDTETTFVPYKDPLEPVDEGYGYKGTLARTTDGEWVQCHVCGFFFSELGTHIKRHKLNADAYRQKFQLSKRTALVSEKRRIARINKNLGHSTEVKAKALENLKKGWEKRTESGDNKKTRSLEYRNKKGRCYYQLLDKIERLGKELGRTPKQREFMQKYGTGDSAAVARTYGSWNQAISLAGFTPTSFSGSRAKYSRDSIIVALRNFYEIEGRVPRHSDLGDLLPGPNIIHRQFGGIIEARRAAGFGQADYVNEKEE